MKAVIITRPGGPEVLQIEERPVPTYGPREVLVKVEAAGVNRPDIAQRKGSYPPPPGAPQDIPGLEIAGVVTEAGSEVTRWKVGDRICALVSGGGYAQYCNVPEEQCLPVPENILLLEAATLPETLFTVWSNVFQRGRLKPGETLLVHGGSSGIGVTAIQMAKAMGSKVIVTAGDDNKCGFCEKIGATRAINYRTEKFDEVVKELTEGKGVDVILDMIGGDYFPLNIQSLAEDGRLVMINTMQGNKVSVDLHEVMRKRLIITGSTLRSRDSAFKGAIATELEQQIWPLLAAGKIRPIIFEVFPFEEAAKAHQLMESSRHIGKIVLNVV
jgi:NADPH2:quinone reductase